MSSFLEGKRAPTIRRAPLERRERKQNDHGRRDTPVTHKFRNKGERDSLLRSGRKRKPRSITEIDSSSLQPQKRKKGPFRPSPWLEVKGKDYYFY